MGEQYQTDLSAVSDSEMIDTIEYHVFPNMVLQMVAIGEESGYFVGGGGDFGQARDASIVSYNYPPKGQPGLWCQWVPTEDNTGIEWNGSEKFYSYVEWLRYLVDNFIKPWGYVLSGRVTWRGEDHGDVGAIVVADNIVEAIDGIATRTCPKCGTSVEAD